jgi:hypothetical protein
MSQVSPTSVYDSHAAAQSAAYTARYAAEIRRRDAKKRLEEDAVLTTALPLPSNMHFDKGEAVTLIVGEEKQDMLVHACHISKNSEFFRTALKKEWLEGQTRTITLPVDDRKIVTQYLNFTYSGELPSGPGEEGSPRDWSTERLLRTYKHLADLYTLGVRLLDDAVRNAVNKQFLQLQKILEVGPGEDSIDIIYKGTSEGDPARRLMVDIYLSWADRDCLDKEADPAFLFDVAQALFQKIEDHPPSCGDTDGGYDEEYEGGLRIAAYLI